MQRTGSVPTVQKEMSARPVVERDGTFKASNANHNYPVEAGASTAPKIIKAVKAKVLEEKFKPASAIVEEVIMVLKE